MAPRPGTYQASMTAGELDRRVHGRTDIKQYYAGAAYMQRLTPVPQSGCTNDSLLGSQLLGQIRPVQQALAFTVTQFFDPGVDPNIMQDLGVVKTTPPVNAPAILVTVDLGSVQAVSSLDLIEFAGTNASGNRPLFCQSSADGAGWQAFGSSYAIDVESRTRRFSLFPGGSRQARYLRVVVDGAATYPGVMTVLGVRVNTNGTAASFRIRKFTFSRDESYALVFTVNNIDVWRDNIWQAAIPAGLSDDQVATVDAVQQLDTMFLLHEGLQPLRVMRQGADDEWTCWFAPFRRIPEVDLGGVYVNGLSAIYGLQLVNTSGTGIFVLSVNGEDTEGLVEQSTAAATCAVIKAGIEALPSVEPGIVVTYDGGTSTYSIEFGGADNLGSGWTMTARMVSPAAGAIVVSQRRKGRDGGEPIMSAGRGWPRCGAFYQQRLVLGGFAAKPNAWLASATGDYFDFNIDVVADTGAYLGAIDTVGAERIERIVFGTFLHFLTSDREYYLTDATLKRSQAPNIRKATDNGIRRGVPAVTTDTTTLFAHKNGSNIVEMVYSDAEQNYVATNISVLSSDLLKGITDMAFRGAIDADDAGALHVVNADGTMRVFVMLKQQDITAAPGRFETDGLVRTVCVTGQDQVLIGVVRPVGSGTVQTLELVGGDVPLDCWQRFTAPSATTLVSGLAGFHEGRTVWAIADGVPTGPFTVSGGQITLPVAATVVEIGRWQRSELHLLPVPKEVGDKAVVQRPVRVCAVRAHVIDTSSIALGSETDGPFDIDLLDYGQPSDVQLLTNPVTRLIAIEGLRGWSEEGKVVVSQKRPGRLGLRDITVETER